MGSISGHVYLNGSLKPIAGIEVTCGNQTDTTQKSGRYAIANITAGSWKIIASGAAYESFEAWVIISANQETIHNIFLHYRDSQK